jgi:hypothetical protein
MRSPTRRTTALVVALTLFGALVAVMAPAVTRAPRAAAALASNSDPDYATVEFSDPWDFSNREDFPGDGAQNLSAYNVTNGVLDAHVNAGGGLILAEAIAGAYPLGRSTTIHPINATNLRKVSFRIWADQTRSGGFFWYTCDHIIPSCENGFAFVVQAGWHDYAFDIPSQATFRGAPGWGGTIKGIRLVPSGSSNIHIFLDYLRLVPSSASSTPPSPVVPLPVVDNPSAAGGIDFASLVRGDAWDMSQPSDIAAPENMSYGIGGGLLNGINAGPGAIDAHFSLPLAGPIDGNRFHRLSFSVFYEGPFSLANGPGGGMVARLIWQTAIAPGVWQNSDDIVVYPGWNNVSLDLASSPAWAITDPETAVRIGWSNQLITSVRFDPHEDSGARRFLVDNIKIAEDATGYGGSYNIRFHDNAWRAGTTADIYTTTSPGSFGGTPIASGIPVNQGINSFLWSPNPLTPGTVWVYVVLHRGPYLARAFASGPLRMTASPSPLYGTNPFGSLEAMTSGQAGVHARGWAIDPDTKNAIDVHFWVDGRTPVAVVTANGVRDDVGQKYPGFGSAHGFDAMIPVPQGTHSVCAHAINVGAGTNRQLGCRTVTVRTNPFGRLDAAAAKVGYASIRGWAIDPNRLAPIDVHVWVDGKFFTALTADDNRPDIAAAVSGYGAAHGYSAKLKLPSGPHSICTYGINTGPGANALLGCKSVTLPANPFGSLDSVNSTSSGIKVRGWAIDPNTKASITVHLYVLGGGAFPVLADVPRPDLIPMFGYGGAHGFVTTLPGSASNHTVCAYGINQGAGVSTLLGCRTG